jgi:hypothetical protein
VTLQLAAGTACNGNRPSIQSLTEGGVAWANETRGSAATSLRKPRV